MGQWPGGNCQRCWRPSCLSSQARAHHQQGLNALCVALLDGIVQWRPAEDGFGIDFNAIGCQKHGHAADATFEGSEV